MKRLLVSTLVALGNILAIDFAGADWPQYRYDANRSAASPERLPADLHLRWVRKLHAPRPAFPTEKRLRFDASYEPIVLGKTMFVPSMVTDSVTALDIENGIERWRFFTDGPVRFAPVGWNEKVYFVSDDGHLYCLDAGSGELLWKFRGLPADGKERKILGNGRLISLWPARGGPVLDAGVIYFAAGLWPSDGVFIHALDAENGTPIWSNGSSNRIPRANMDHGVAQYAGLTPQGYLAMVGGKLVVPCGAQLPAFLDPKTGVLGDYTMGWGGRVGLPKGSWFVAGAGKYLSHSGDLYDITQRNEERFREPRRGRENFKPMLYPSGFQRLMIDPTNQRELGEFRQPVISQNGLFYGDPNEGIVALDLAKVRIEERSTLQPTKYRKEDKYPDKLKASFGRLWRLESKLRVHIESGKRLYVGGEGIVQAIDLPERNKNPRISWQSEIEGTPQRMLAADGKLFVVTKEGAILSFSSLQPPADIAVFEPAHDSKPKADGWTTRVRKILGVTQATDGYALVLGIGEGRIVEELTRQSHLYVIGVDKDAQRVARVREALHSAGLYGTRATVHVGDPKKFPFPPYLANLIVVEDPAAVGSLDGKFVANVFRLLRPYGGTAYLNVSEAGRKTILKWIDNEPLPGLAIRQAKGAMLLVREGALPGAADWSHDGATAANTAASQDRCLKAPLGLLWFDGSTRWHRKPGSAIVRIAGGRVFILAEQLHAIDAYTGRYLWEVKFRTNRGPGSDMVAVDEALYVTTGDVCLVLDAATGKKSREIDRPKGTSEKWSNLRIWEDFLVTTLGKRIVCLKLSTGDVAWTYECERARLSLAVGNGKVFCSELLNPRRGEDEKTAKTTTRAFDLSNGEILWEIAGGSDIHYSEPHDLLVTAGGIYQGKDGYRVRDGIASSRIVGEQVVSGNSDKFTVFDLLTGDQKGEELTWNRRGCTGLRASCNLITTRFKGNAAYFDLRTRDITPLWNIRTGCNNNLYPSGGLLNAPNITGGCECNYTPTSKAFAPLSVILGSVE